MLNLLVMVRNFFFLMLGLWLPFLTGSFQISRPKIDSPQNGEALQGVVEIMGTSEIVGFQGAEVAFAYGKDSSTWFLITGSDQPVRDGVWHPGIQPPSPMALICCGCVSLLRMGKWLT